MQIAQFWENFSDKICANLLLTNIRMCGIMELRSQEQLAERQKSIGNLHKFSYPTAENFGYLRQPQHKGIKPLH